MELRGTQAVVTGGASGLGAATAHRLAEAGMTVNIVDRHEAAAEVAHALHGRAFRGDVADGAAMETVFHAVGEARAHDGPLRVLVCCAGVGMGRKVVRTSGVHDLESFERVVRVNLTGTFDCVRLAAGLMHDQQPDGSDGERGVIVTTSSAAAFDGVDGGVAYSASKAGVAGMTLPLARDLGRYGIRVVSIAPGPFETRMSVTMPEEYRGMLADETPFPPRFGHVREFADAVVFLAGNPMMNGSVLRLDGGIRMRPETVR